MKMRSSLPSIEPEQETLSNTTIVTTQDENVAFTTYIRFQVRATMKKRFKNPSDTSVVSSDNTPRFCGGDPSNYTPHWTIKRAKK